MALTRAVLCLAAIAFTPTLASGQGNTTKQLASVRSAQLHDLEQSTSLPVPLTRASAEITAKDKRIMANWAIEMHDIFLAIGASGPLADGSNDSRLADLDGLRNATTVKVEIAHTHWTTDIDSKSAQAFCRAYRRQHPMATAISDTTCTELSFPERDRQAFSKASSVKWGTPWIITAYAQFGQQKLDYADASDAHEIKMTGHPSAAGIGIGRYYPRSRVLWAMAYRHENGFKPGKEADFITPFGAGAYRSSKLPLGPPSTTRDDIATVELRHFLNSSLGVGLALTANLRSPEVGAAIPFLLRTAESQGFRSGLVLGWVGRKDSGTELSIAAFTGVAMGINVFH